MKVLKKYEEYTDHPNGFIPTEKDWDDMEDMTNYTPIETEDDEYENMIADLFNTISNLRKDKSGHSLENFLRSLNPDDLKTLFDIFPVPTEAQNDKIKVDLKPGKYTSPLD